MGILGRREIGLSVRDLAERAFGRGFHILACDESVEVSSGIGKPIFQMFFTSNRPEIYDNRYRELVSKFLRNYENVFLDGEQELIPVVKPNPFK